MKINVRKILIFLIIILVFRIVYKVYIFNYKYSEWKNKKIIVEIYNVEKTDDEKIVYRVKYNNDMFLLNIDNGSNELEAGDKITIISNMYKIKSYNNPYEFNYKRYLNSNNIVSVIYCNKVIEMKAKSNKVITAINYIRSTISNKLDAKLIMEESNLMKSFMYGDDTYINKELKEKFIDIGIGHILCVSGTHVSFLLIVFEKMTDSKKRNKFNFVILLYFYIISFFKISLFRPICMYILLLINKEINFYSRISLSFVLVLIINPYYIFNIGIIFSYLSVLGIKLFYTIIDSWFSIKIKKKKKIIQYIISNISLTFSSQILILPFQIYFFQKVSLISILSNICIYFILNILMYCTFILFILFFIPVVSDLIIYMCSKLLHLIIFQVEYIHKINYFNISLPKPSLLVFIAFYTIIVVMLYKKLIIVYFWKYRKVLKNLANTLKYICILYIFYWYINTMYFEKYIIYFNVGQGNMALLHFNTKNIIIDIGSTKENIAGNIIGTFLKAKNINNVDLVLLTHMHNDHINGLDKLVSSSNIHVKKVCYTKPYKKVDEYIKLKKVVKDNKIATLEVIEGDVINIDEVEINILSPPKSYYITDEDMLNANSTVYLISKNSKNYLFMGDSTKNTEKYILNNYIKKENNTSIKDKLKNISIYQVSHHGSKTSSYEEFVKEISADKAIFSAQKSVYGHPADEIIEIFKYYNYKIYLTEKNGAIKF